jgi:hypothetical protein
MANVDVVHTHDGNMLFYNVDAAVGKGCPNRRPDVLLVQYLLKECCKAPKLAYIRTSVLSDEKYMKITGTWDQDWDTYLLNYQNELKHRGMSISKDGRVDPVAGLPRGPIHHTQYTILYLNLGYGALRPGDLPRLADVGDCPGELRDLLKPEFVSAA